MGRLAKGIPRGTLQCREDEALLSCRCVRSPYGRVGAATHLRFPASWRSRLFMCQRRPEHLLLWRMVRPRLVPPQHGPSFGHAIFDLARGHIGQPTTSSDEEKLVWDGVLQGRRGGPAVHLQRGRSPLHSWAGGIPLHPLEGQPRLRVDQRGAFVLYQRRQVVLLRRLCTSII